MTDSVSSATNAHRADILSALRSAAESTGVDFGFLLKTAQRESGLKADAKASTSSASGLFQFTSETWLSMIDRYGAGHGVAADATRDQKLALRNDPQLAANMAGELAKENAGILEKKLGRTPTQAELYAAHFMGPAEAARLVEAARRNVDGPAANLFPHAAKANANVFHSPDGQPLTAAGLYQKLTGMDVATADGGHAVQQASTALAHIAQPEALLAARLGVAQLTHGLMEALLGLQQDDKA